MISHSDSRQDRGPVDLRTAYQPALECPGKQRDYHTLGFTLQSDSGLPPLPPAKLRLLRPRAPLALSFREAYNVE